MKLTLRLKSEVEVRYLRAVCDVRYWEDTEVNGQEDDEGKLIPLRTHDSWCLTIDLHNGQIIGWPQGVEASVHYKVCDEGVYSLLDENKNLVVQKDGYVPSMLCPKDRGYGDYIIMDIDGKGMIDKFSADLSYFEEDDANE